MEITYLSSLVNLERMSEMTEQLHMCKIDALDVRGKSGDSTYEMGGQC